MITRMIVKVTVWIKVTKICVWGDIINDNNADA